MLRNQTSAPDFSLLDQDSHARSLAELRGDGPLLLFFYRGAFCQTSRAQLLNYADNYSRFRWLGAQVAAICVDPPETSRAMADDLEIQFSLLTDADFSVSQSYHIYQSDDGEGPQPHGEPAVFIIDVDGNIAFSQVQTGPRASAPATELALVLLYMRENGGRY